MLYIDKSALVAEIARLQATTMDEDGNFYTAKAQAEYNVLCMLDSFLDTLEVKEIYKQSPTKDLKTAAGNYAFTQSEEDEVLKYYAFIAGAKWQEEQTIDKACEWLADNYSKYIITNGLATIFSATIDFDTIRMIEDFKKAMEK